MFSKLKIILILLVLCPFLVLANDDSTGITLRQGKVFKLHKVEKGEGLYSIGRRYNVNWKTISDANPGTDDGLQLDQILYIPTGLSEKDFFNGQKPVYTKGKSEYSKPTEPSKDPKPDVKEQAETKKTEASKTSFTSLYKVQKGETLYSISQKFSTTVEFLVQLNRLSSSSINEGMDILVPMSDPAQSSKDNTNQKEASENDSSNSKTMLSKNPNDFYKYQIKKEFLKEYNIEKITENGLGIISTDKSIHRERNSIMHHNAPLNTIIRITNPANNKSTYVKVVKNFKRPESDSPIIYINKETADFLSLDDHKPFGIIISFAK